MSATLKAQRGRGGGGIGPEEHLVPVGFHMIQDPISSDDATPALGRESRVMGVAFVSENQRAEVLETPYARQLTTGGGKPGQGYPMARIGHGVRRLTPRECERLQGFPDDWTLIPGATDSKRYAALGNAVTVNVVEWIARRLVAVEAQSGGGLCA